MDRTRTFLRKELSIIEFGIQNFSTFSIFMHFPENIHLQVSLLPNTNDL